MQNNRFNELRQYLLALPKLADTGRDKRILKAKEDFRYFVTTYFPHHINFTGSSESSRFRKFIYKNINKLTAKHNKMLFLAYRGSAKTTLISKLYSLWQIAKADKKYIVIISSNQEMATEVLETFKIECEDNINFREDFNLTIGNVWQSDEIVVNINLGSSQTNKIKIRAVGISQKIRGLNFLGARPDLIILDDCENDENVKSKLQRDKLYSLFNKAILKLPDRKANYNIIVIGTMLHYDALLARIKARNDFVSYNFPLVTKYPDNLDSLTEDNINEIVRTAELDDPDIDTSSIFHDFLSDKSSFYSEYQNEPLSDDMILFNQFESYNVLPKCDYFFLGIDPSLGKSKGDYFAIAKLGYLKKTGKYYASVNGFRVAPDKMINLILTIYIKIIEDNIPCKIAIETVQFQQFFADTLSKRAREKFGITLPVVELKNSVAKELRIDSLSPHINSGDILIDETNHLLIEELMTYPKSAHDDLLDALEMAFRVANKRKSLDYKVVEDIMKRYEFNTRIEF